MSLGAKIRLFGYAFMSPATLARELDREEGEPVHEDRIDDGWAWDCYAQRERPIAEIQRDESLRRAADNIRAARLLNDPVFQEQIEQERVEMEKLLAYRDTEEYARSKPGIDLSVTFKEQAKDK